jgi:hypothetical protein
MKVGSIDEITDADCRAESVVGKNLEMRGEICAGEILLGHRPVCDVLEAEVAMRVDFPRHDRLSGQIDMRGAGRDLQRALAANFNEAIIGDDES